MDLDRTYNKASGELEHDLRRDIYRRQMLPGEKLSSELQLARKYHISRSTVRKALDSLADEGLEVLQGLFLDGKPIVVGMGVKKAGRDAEAAQVYGFIGLLINFRAHGNYFFILNVLIKFIELISIFICYLLYNFIY